MAFQILLNFFIAVVWMFMSSSLTPSTFIIGYLIGLLMIIMTRRYFSGRLYIWRIWSAVKLTAIFLKELILSNISVLLLVIKPDLSTMQPMFFAMPTELEKDWEITLLSSLITLTPGTVVVHVSDDQRTLYIHAIDVDDVDEAIDSIKNTFEKAIMEVSRG
ncbi:MULTISPECIES: Na+/H+ antiporter subunit E [unclassified Sporosarcina]|uniref:Na+/H+ antiporter subunit E n=1 Tax=unclassified Sporosarcina TaxID=2647733 RepID=UPI000C162FFE|nr:MULTISPECIES: Na+/H+ antiporter subunit E [unclassified Sporosarcina]PIC56638.1 Na+/H+ antiporter subunit E [Sporosarcina sp. P10]PIC59854.1 Na+/H+ antiporter subunit E [Sporosarcina sp. P12(2017)]PIC99285.1 Na+/H+ antiporter subunit E [Sporosarcina sp. P29]PID05356.1 Na+/H+ antiporter subunit E [Sporosarcina sp. P30]PID08551.1 Na+/H+ antiporter subunit E [Sporosarcina sp. P31]